MICPKCNGKMTLLFISAVCDRCNPPMSAGAAANEGKLTYCFGFVTGWLAVGPTAAQWRKVGSKIPNSLGLDETPDAVHVKVASNGYTGVYYLVGVGPDLTIHYVEEFKIDVMDP